MHSISSRYRKPKGRPSKRRKAAAENSKQRFLNDGLQSTDLVEIRNDINHTELIETVRELVPENSIVQSAKYTIMHENCWSSLLEKVSCSECNTVNCLQIHTGTTYGFSSKLELICSACNYSYGSTFSSSRIPSSRQFEINQGLASAFLSIGRGHAAIQTFSMILGMPGMDKKTFSNCLDNLCESNAQVKNEILKFSNERVRNAHIELNSELTTNDVIGITVSYDGTWQKRGHSSLYGVFAVIDVLTGLVIDFEVLSKYCPDCVTAARDLGENSAEFKIWDDGHKKDCQKNFEGSSGSMEMCAAFKMWSRSNNQKLQYRTVLSDGDSKTHQELNEKCVYGKDVTIEKEECINHVAKRLGTALRNKVKEWRTKGVTLGGKKKGSLTDVTITKLQNFYRKAIKENAPDVDKMKSSILATLYHCMSSDEKPHHNKCPKGVASWCFYQRAIAKKEAPKSHKNMKTQLREEVVEKILPVYQRLAASELLLRCISGKTQNANESLHSVIWNKCPKEIFVSKKRLELAVIAAISEFNFGCTESLKFHKTEINDNSLRIAKRHDNTRNKQKRKRSSNDYKKHVITNKLKKKSTNAKEKKSEGCTYAAGAF